MIRFLFWLWMLAFVPLEKSIADESVALEDVPQVELDVWRPRWTESLGELQSMVVDILDNEAFSSVDDASKSAALKELNAALEKSFSWERVGQDYVRQMLLQYCGADLLNEIAPYRSDPEMAKDVPEELTNRYTSCWIDVDLQVNTAPAMLSMRFFSEQVGSILRRHGIDPNGGPLN